MSPQMPAFDYNAILLKSASTDPAPSDALRGGDLYAGFDPSDPDRLAFTHLPLPSPHLASGDGLVAALGHFQPAAGLAPAIPVPATMALVAGVCFATGMTMRRRRTGAREAIGSGDRSGARSGAARREFPAYDAVPRSAYRFDPIHDDGRPERPRFGQCISSDRDPVVVLTPREMAPETAWARPAAAEADVRPSAGAHPLTSAQYRMFTLDAGSVRSCRNFSAADDYSALAQARRCEPKQGFELWRGGALVASQPQID
ncbi:hypothetical protein [Polymorphobacter fuscus]|uniref:Uncharacterized protein n=1 Tax=Sandarakinorhabdus fusca TaxID=1439888 RepID=A0A7C9GT68_9SPHN|nr:hypothetical protein [Polymorphobacter fuscus]KAB7648448.1 hypothetical protein F9290_01660 [Polymorphobacter fuscus]MQT15969.1 hypothetical protein [Polymorphobacter fuscus]NJC07754.1 hypothetical protein [Polymorphobacter fuscus]